MYYTVDRIEENYAVVFDSNDIKTDISLLILPEKVKEGDILIFDDITQTYIIDEEKTAQTKNTINERFQRLLKKKEI